MLYTFKGLPVYLWQTVNKQFKMFNQCGQRHMVHSQDNVMKLYLLPVVSIWFNQYLYILNNSVDFFPCCKAPDLKSACIIEHIYVNLIVLQLAGFVVLCLLSKQAAQGEAGTKLSNPSLSPHQPHGNLLKTAVDRGKPRWFQTGESGTFPISHKNRLWSKLRTMLCSHCILHLKALRWLRTVHRVEALWQCRCFRISSSYFWCSRFCRWQMISEVQRYWFRLSEEKWGDWPATRLT